MRKMMPFETSNFKNLFPIPALKFWVLLLIFLLFLEVWFNNHILFFAMDAYKDNYTYHVNFTTDFSTYNSYATNATTFATDTTTSDRVEKVILIIGTVLLFIYVLFTLPDNPSDPTDIALFSLVFMSPFRIVAQKSIFLFIFVFFIRLLSRIALYC